MQMLKFNETPGGYIFSFKEDSLAMGIYDDNGFQLLHKDEVVTFNNAQQAFSHLRSIYEPSVPSPKTMELFLTPSRPIDNMSKYRDNVILKDMPKEVFHANLPN